MNKFLNKPIKRNLELADPIKEGVKAYFESKQKKELKNDAAQIALIVGALHLIANGVIVKYKLNAIQ